MDSDAKDRGPNRDKFDEMGVDDREFAWRRAFNEFAEEDVRRLLAMHPAAERHASEIIERFYAHLMSFDETRAFFRDPRLLERVKRGQTGYFLQLTQGRYDHEYVRSRLRIGEIHQRIDMPLKAYFGMFNFYLRAVAEHLLTGETVARDAIESFLSLLKLVFLDISLAIEADVYGREATIHSQAEVIRELSTPVLQVRDRLLIVPLIGVIDTPRARQLTEQLLGAIRANRARVVVMDITGVAVVDSAVANHLLQTVQASRLMGARVIITGISAEIAQTLVRIGVDMAKLDTVGDLQEGIAEAERLLGYRVVRDDAPAGGVAPQGDPRAEG